jgi:hypothetical protein
MSDQSVQTAVLESRLDGHEKVCTERYGEIKESFVTVHDRLNDIQRGVIGILVGIVVFMISVIGTIAYNGLPWVR